VRRSILAIDRALGLVESAMLAALVAAITAVTFAQVFSRYVIADPIIWSEEVARYLFVWITMIGAAAAVRLRGHFGLDILRRWVGSSGLRKGLGLITALFVAGFLCILFYAGVNETWQASGQFSSALPITLMLPYLALPVGSAAALFHLFAHWVGRGAGAHPLDAPDPCHGQP
jgi:TRAP-type C4-dicarboxylate transport system permease small subunit